MLILLIEDDPAIVRFLERGLAAHGHRTISADNGEDGLLMAAEEAVELVLLDVMLPRMDGRRVLERIRLRRPDLPVLMLTARDGVHDKVEALDLGADDYLTKPFEMVELLARIEALLRRAPAASGVSLERFQFGNVFVDVRKAEVSREGTPVELSAKEFHLLRYFVEHRGATLSREELLTEVWGYHATPSTRTVDVHVAWLRQKLEPNPRVPQYIVTVHGLGYKFAG